MSNKATPKSIDPLVDLLSLPDEEKSQSEKEIFSENTILSRFKEVFPKEWIIELRNQYCDFISSYSLNSSFNENFFKLTDKTGLGSYDNRNDKYSKEISDYFERLLFAPNLAILEYVIKNLQIFQNLKFLDHGSGFGLLSIFLKKINIDCYNFDNFSQMGTTRSNRREDVAWALHDQNNFFKYYQIPIPTDVLPTKDIDVVVNIGTKIQEEVKYLNSKYLLIDPKYATNPWPSHYDKYASFCGSPNKDIVDLLSMYKHKDVI